MTDLPPPSSPGTPGSFGPPGGQPPAPPGWGPGPAPGAGGQSPFGSPPGFGGSSPIPVGPPPSPSKNRLPLIILAILVLAGAGVGIFLITKGGDETTTVEVTLPKTTTPPVTVPATLPEVTAPEETLPEATLPQVTEPEKTFPPETVAPETTASSTQAAADMTVSDQWFYPDSPGSNDYDWGVIVTNSGSQSYRFVQVEADFYDDQNRLVSTETQFFSTVIPGKNVAISYMGSAPATPTRMEPRVVIDEFMSEATPAPSGTLTFDQIAVANTTDFSFDVIGQVTSTYADTVENVTVFGIWRDANGAVITAQSTYIDHIPPGTPTLFSLNVFSDTLERIPPGELYFSLS